MPNVIIDRRSAQGTSDFPFSVRPGSQTTTTGTFRGTSDARSAPATIYTMLGTGYASDTSSIDIASTWDQEFHSLVEQWRRETGMLSSASKKAMHPAYQRIIGMGERAITPIMQELQRRPDHWFWALNAITGETPVPQESAGNLRWMAQAWIEWGRRKGYIASHGA